MFPRTTSWEQMKYKQDSNKLTGQFKDSIVCNLFRKVSAKKDKI